MHDKLPFITVYLLSIMSTTDNIGNVPVFTTSSQLSLLLAHIQKIKDALIAGSIVVFEDNRIRIRSLPIG